MSSAKGKFINAFSSIKMLGDYEGNENDDKDVDLFSSSTAAPSNDAIGNNTQLGHEEENGSELYNPLDDMDIVNENDEKEMEISYSPTGDKDMKIDNVQESKEALESNTHAIFADENTKDGSVMSSKDDEDEASSEQEKKIIEELENVQQNSDLRNNHIDFLDDHDELLGTALAELEEEEEKERQQELETLKLQICQSTDDNSSKKKKRKKEERRSKERERDVIEDEKDSKKKKKKRKKKKKVKDTGEGKKKKKSKEKKETEEELGIDELLEKIKEEEKRESLKKQESKTSKSFKKEKSSHEKSSSKENKKEDSSRKGQEKEMKNSDRKRSDRKRSLSVERKHDSKNSRDHSRDYSRSSRQTSKDSEPIKKRSRKDDSPEQKHSHKKEDREHYEKKRVARKGSSESERRIRKENSEESELRRKHKVGDKTTSYEIDKVDYEIKMPDHKKKESPLKLSKDEFYRLQREARTVDNPESIENQKLSKNRSISPISEQEKELDISINHSTLHENFPSEQRKFRDEHRHEVRELDTIKQHENSLQDKRPRRISENITLSRQKSHSPEKISHDSYNNRIKDHNRRRSVSENNSNIDFSLTRSNEKEKEHNDLYEFGFETNHDVYDDKLVIKNEDSPSEALQIYSISSHSDTESSLVLTDDKSNHKPGAISLRQYKERRRSSKTAGNSHHSSEKKRRDESNRKKEGKSPSERNEALHFDRENKENVPGKSDVTQASSKYAADGDQEDLNNYSDNMSIPLLFDETSKDKLNDLSDHNKSGKSHTSNGQESPYNPEASPLDMASPSDAAIEDGTSVEFSAFKDNVAFEDIMKSKVKHEARKHRRRKLDELKAEYGSPPIDSKEGKLIDYLVRQAQVEEHMKNVLKQYFKTREITKEEYKNILKKAVPQVTMSNSPIIPEKIESLMTKFVRKCKGQRAKEQKVRRKEQKQLAEQQKQLQLQLQTSAAMFQQIRVLNPNLPMPPV